MHRFRPLSVAALLMPTILAGQQQPRSVPAPNAITMSFKFFAGHYSGWLATAFDSIPAAKYTYRPTPAQQSVGYIAQHLEGANYGLCNRFGAMKHHTSAKDSLADTVKAAWPKDTLVARFRASLAFCDAALMQLSDANLLDHVPYGPAGSGATALPARSLIGFVTDLAEHYSQVASYMRLMGLIPPSALPPKPRTAIDLPVAVLSRYVGRYDLPPSVLQDAPPFLLDVTLKDGALYFKPTGRPTFRVWPETETDFFVKEVDVQITFTKDANGAISGLVVHQNGEDRAARRLPR
jgi:Uncharacterized protein conserved in bacteria